MHPQTRRIGLAPCDRKIGPAGARRFPPDGQPRASTIRCTAASIAPNRFP